MCLKFFLEQFKRGTLFDAGGRLFQRVGADTEKALSPITDTVFGFDSVTFLILLALQYEKSSDRYVGARPFRDL